MKLLHVSDLHIGKKIYEFSMLEDQKFILDQISSLAEERRADGVLLAGDLYDKSIPSAEAVTLLDAFLTGLADRGVKVFAVSGNHDSAERMAFGAGLLGKAGVHLSPVYDGKVKKIVCRDAYGEVCIYLLPFLKPSIVRAAFGEEEIESYQDAVRIAIGHLAPDPSCRNVLVAHQLVTGAQRSESEEIHVGGMDNVDASLFDAFDYVALGHIHKPQSIGRSTLRYCGSPLKYSFSEAEQEKSVTLVELREKGDVRLEFLPLRPLREMRRIRGSYLEAARIRPGSRTEDYVQVILTDEEEVPDAARKLRNNYPNLMHLEYDNSRTREDRLTEQGERPEEKTEEELFEKFFETQNNSPMEEWQASFLRGLLKELKEGEKV